MRHMLDRWMRWRIGRSGLMEFIGLSLMGLFLAVFQAFDSEHGAPIRNLIYWQAAMLGGGCQRRDKGASVDWTNSDRATFRFSHPLRNFAFAPRAMLR